MIPKILIVAEEGYANDIPHFVVNLDYVNLVSQTGGLPLTPMDAKCAQDYADFADGLILTGGPDIHCARYGEYYTDQNELQTLSRNREAFEFELCRSFLQAQKPIFGIGRGMQILNVALGGTLFRDISGHCSSPDASFPLKAAPVYHDVTVCPESRLRAVLHERKRVCSCHHQAIKDLGSDLITAAVCADGIVEAVEHRSLPCFGVQWHPEHTAEDLPADSRLFSYFIALCREGCL